MPKYRVTIETEIADPLAYIGRKDLMTSKALENEIVKMQMGLDIVEALRKYGTEANVTQVRRITNDIK